MVGSFFVYLYPFVVFMSIVGYLPQLKSLIYAKTKPDNISIYTWYIWCLTGVLTLGYAIFHIRDIMFIISSGIGSVLILATTILIYYNLYYRFTMLRKRRIVCKRRCKRNRILS